MLPSSAFSLRSSISGRYCYCCSVDGLQKEDMGKIMLAEVPTEDRGGVMLLVVPTMVLTSSAR